MGSVPALPTSRSWVEVCCRWDFFVPQKSMGVPRGLGSLLQWGERTFLVCFFLAFDEQLLFVVK